MLLFCPSCSNMLRVSRIPPGDPSTQNDEGNNRFECQTCPYQYVLNRRYYERKTMKRKEEGDILGGKDAWKNVDTTIVQCTNEKCRNDTAYWYQLQIRSADEPMTAFYKCTQCDNQWRE
ncbi:hypothetical protein BDV96DRAFT_96852 [Lophiotrema nucula]|uniref:DNA-directed RNA polymerase subunit n=1 Tax=Lophiotrema nucula TaxID=690887 RepID=A0A6A5Z4L7_9PLEO|nr:hypothetical protein BDV96DRAFT_96852 [Lophiotrema nucula]